MISKWKPVNNVNSSKESIPKLHTSIYFLDEPLERSIYWYKRRYFTNTSSRVLIISLCFVHLLFSRSQGAVQDVSWRDHIGPGFCPFKRGCPLFRGYKCIVGIQKQAFGTTNSVLAFYINRLVWTNHKLAKIECMLLVTQQCPHLITSNTLTHTLTHTLHTHWSVTLLSQFTSLTHSFITHTSLPHSLHTQHAHASHSLTHHHFIVI